MSSKITKEEIDVIVNQKNLLIRNLQITLGYYKVGRRLRKFLGDSNVNWFGFGCYASKTAGRTLRHELLPGSLKSAMIRAAGYDNTYMYLHNVLEKDDDPTVLNPDSLLAEVLSRVSLLVSKGNLMIFEELAWPFVDLVDTFKRHWEPNEAEFQPFLDKHLTPGPFEEGGQDLLRESFTCFYRARFETNKKKKAELIYMGNMLLGFHEQSRLQPVIEAAIAVPFDVFTQGLIPDNDDSLRKKVARRTIGFSRQMVLRTVTRMTMTYSLPTRELKLGKDLVAPTDLINFPQELRAIENPRCRELVLQFSGKVDTLSGSAAGNWGSLVDRMNFLVDFFRSYQHYKPLFQPPFMDNQIPVIEAGQFPGGPL
ncbi:MAG: hypothetical protein GY803_29255 [Chloroflexi bacterium]|nr:hypothetical protein [Chloroflexota bacterium]